MKVCQGGEPYVRVHYNITNPQSIEIVHGNEDDKKVLVDEIYDRLQAEKDYSKHLASKGRKGTRIYFEYKTRVHSKALSPLAKFLIEKGNFKTAKPANKKLAGFRTQNYEGHIVVVTQCLDNAKRKVLLDKIFIFLKQEGFTKLVGGQKSKFSFKVFNTDPGYENVKKFFNNTDPKPAAEVVFSETDKVEPRELVKQFTVEDSSKSFGNKMIGFLIKQLTEDPDLYDRIGILYQQQKADPAETKRLFGEILEKEFNATPVSFEGPMGKFYSAKEISDLISRVIEKLPS